MEIRSNYFYGNEVSEYGQKNGYVDYRTLAKAFDAVLNNDIMTKTYDIGYWDMVSGYTDNSEEIEEIREQIEEIESKIEELEELEEIRREASEEIERLEDVKTDLESKIEELEEEQDNPGEVFQWYIVSDNGADILQEAGEIVYYNETLDMYLWGVTHYGTSWDYVLTDIKINREEV